MLRVLFLDDDLNFRDSITRALCKQGVEVTEVSNLPAFESRILENQFDLVILRKKLLGRNYLELIENFKQYLSKSQIILLGITPAAECRIAAYQAGYDQLLEDPVHRELLLAVAQTAMRRVFLTHKR